MDEEVTRWAASRTSGSVFEIPHGRIMVSEAARQFDLRPSEIEVRIDKAKVGMEHARLKTCANSRRPCRR
jgi:hypothetical protein